MDSKQDMTVEKKWSVISIQRAPSGGCWAVRVCSVEIVDNGSIQDVPGSYPGSLLWSVALPFHKYSIWPPLLLESMISFIKYNGDLQGWWRFRSCGFGAKFRVDQFHQ